MKSPTSRPVLFSLSIVALSLAASALLLAGCASPAGIAPTHKLLDPAQLGAQPPAGSTSINAQPAPDATPWPKERWWTAYGDPVLDGLVDKALANQPSLQTVQARLAQAQAIVDVNRSALMPQVNGSVELTDQRFSENFIYPPPLAGSIRWTGDARLAFSWDLDIAGGKRAALAAAVGQQRAAQAESQAAALSMASSVASSYVALARLVALREVAVRTTATRDEVLKLVRQRIDAGLDTTVELRQAQGLIAQTRVDVNAVDEQIGRARHALAELTGQGPDALSNLAPQLRSVASAPLPKGLPVDLIGRRPDLVAARWRVEAATEDVKAARAQFYPNVNLTAFLGLQSLGLDQLLKAGSGIYGGGPALHLPVFEAGRLRAGLKQRASEVDVAVDTYNAALLRALREVADEVSTLQLLERQQRNQADALTAAESAYDLATQRYRAGLGTLLVVLSAEGNVLTQRRAVADLDARHLAAEIALARALGGGYHDQGLPPAPAPLASAAASAPSGS